jgi:transcription antitermination protein NusB
VSKHATGPRRRAREVAFRVAFQADVLGDAFAETWEARRAEEHLSDEQAELVQDVVRTLTGKGAEIDGLLRGAAAHWPLERLAGTDRAVLRSAVAELLSRAGTPARVVIDEAIEIAKEFGAEESGRFVNGVLDTIARGLRPAEFA